MQQENNDYITLRSIILSIRDFIQEYFRSWKLVLVIIIATISLFYKNYLKQETVYFAQNKFLIEGTGGTGGGLGSLLSQIGARGQGGKFNPWKISETARSTKTIKEILFQEYNEDFIANHIINVYELDKIWAENNPKYEDFKFKHKNISTFSYIENVALTNLINKVTGGKSGQNPLMIFTYDEESAIFSYLFKTKDEQLSYELVQRNYLWLKHFFENEILASQMATSKIIKEKADSIKAVIGSKTFEAATLADKSQGLVLTAPNSRRITLEKEIVALTSAYADLVTSFENADVGLKDIKPMFLLVDEPLLPLEKEVPSLIVTLIKAIIFSLLFSMMVVISRKIIREALNS